MNSPSDSQAIDLFLPDFCSIRIVFGVVVTAELLAFVLALAGTRSSFNVLDNLALTSLFIQWVALSCAAVLCVSRRYLCRLQETTAAAVSYLSLIAVTGIVSEVAWWLLAGSDDTAWGGSHAVFLLRNLGISAIVSAVALRYFYIQHHWRRRMESESQARIQALQSRIRPHFLFNCMNTIASLTRSRPQAAEQAVEDLADLFRASLGDARHRVPLGEELALCRRYLRIEALRLGDRLRTEWDIDALPGDAMVPALTIQPLLENAIYHGIEPVPEGGVIRISGSRADGELCIVVDNPVGDSASASRRDGNRLAQENVAQRLTAYYGKAGRLQVESGAGHYRVFIHFPYETGEDADTDR